MTLLALIGIALTGWGLFALMVYRAGKRKKEVADARAEAAALLRTLNAERDIFHAQIRLALETGRVDADALNGALDRLRKGKAPR